jgi:hypothetical protein
MFAPTADPAHKVLRFCLALTGKLPGTSRSARQMLHGIKERAEREYSRQHRPEWRIAGHD